MAAELSVYERELLLKAFRIRCVEQALLKLYEEGRIHGTIHTCLGQEIIPVVIAELLNASDVVFSNHRGHGHFLAQKDMARELIAEVLGRSDGLNQGLAGSQHLCAENFYSSGIQGSFVPVAVGTAWEQKRSAQNNITVCYMGDGTLGQGVVYESWNIAANLGAPVLFVVEDNGYAQSTLTSSVMSGSVKDRVKAFGLKLFEGESFDVKRLQESSKAAVDHVRIGKGPAVLHTKTYRLGPHSKGDDYRDKDEIAEHRLKDPVSALVDLRASDSNLNYALKKIEDEVQGIISELNTPVESALKPNHQQQIEPALARAEIDVHESTDFVAVRLNRALSTVLSSREDAIILGEDIEDPYGGAFKVTRGLSTQFPERIVNMPISESAMIGLGLGRSLGGQVTFVEIMFGDFIALGFNQLINVAAKSRVFFADKTAPLVIRTPMGGGQGYGYTHSQSLEKYLAAIEGIDTYLLNSRIDFTDFYLQISQSQNRPAIVIEPKAQYGKVIAGLAEGYESRMLKGPLVHHVKPSSSPDVTVICFASSLCLVEAAAEQLIEDEIYIDIFSPIQINFELPTELLSSLRQTKRLLFVEESPGPLNISSGYLKEIHGSGLTGIAVKFVNSYSALIPASPTAEAAALPTLGEVKRSIEELFDGR